MVNPAPETLAWEMLMVAEPELVKVTVEEPEEPTLTLPKVTAPGLEVRLPCVPVALSGIASVELLALLLMAMEPEAAPAVVGANCAVKFTDWLAVSATGVESPEMLKPAPVVVTLEMVALALPELVSVMVCWPLLPTETLPKETVAGLAARVELVATPLPDMVKDCGEFGALSVKLMLPEAAPFAVGVNWALKFTDWPAVRVIGVARPEMPKPLPVTLAILMVTFELPVLVSLTFAELLWPTVVLPKFQVAGEMERPACAPVPERATETVGSEASLVMVMVPEAAPEAVGEN